MTKKKPKEPLLQLKENIEIEKKRKETAFVFKYEKENGRKPSRQQRKEWRKKNHLKISNELIDDFSRQLAQHIADRRAVLSANPPATDKRDTTNRKTSKKKKK